MTEETLEDQAHVGKDFRGRIGQIDFLFRFVVYVVALIPIKAIIQIPDGMFASALGFLLLLAATYWMLTFSVKRAHDFGMSGSSGWLTLIPLVNLFWFVVLMFRDGDQVTNRYGPPPKQSAEKIRPTIEPTPIATTETERQLEDLRTLHEKGLLSREAYTAAQLDVWHSPKSVDKYDVKTEMENCKCNVRNMPPSSKTRQLNKSSIKATRLSM